MKTFGLVLSPDFQSGNLKWEFTIQTLLNPESFARVNVILLNPDIFPPAIF